MATLFDEDGEEFSFCDICLQNTWDLTEVEAYHKAEHGYVEKEVCRKCLKKLELFVPSIVEEISPDYDLMSHEDMVNFFGGEYDKYGCAFILCGDAEFLDAYFCVTEIPWLNSEVVRYKRGKI